MVYNAGDVEIDSMLCTYDLLKTSIHMASAVQDGDYKGAMECVFAAFNQGYDVGIARLRGCGYYPHDVNDSVNNLEYADMHNFRNYDKKYLPALGEMQSHFSKENMELLLDMGIINEDQVEYFKAGFERSLTDIGTEYVMCVPFFREIKNYGAKKDKASVKKIFQTLYKAATWGQHFAVKERAEMSFKLFEHLDELDDLSIYNSFHKL